MCCACTYDVKLDFRRRYKVPCQTSSQRVLASGFVFLLKIRMRIIYIILDVNEVMSKKLESIAELVADGSQSLSGTQMLMG